MNREELKEFIKENLFDRNGKFNNRVTLYSWWKNKNFEKEYQSVINNTNYLTEDSNITQRVYDILNDIYKLELCEVCNKEYRIFLSLKKGYSYFCSRECSIKSERKTINSKKTNFDRYGDENYRNIEKAKKTNRLRRGVD